MLPDAADLPEPVDAVVVAIPAASVPDALATPSSSGAAAQWSCRLASARSTPAASWRTSCGGWRSRAGCSPCAGRTATGSWPRRRGAAMWGDSTPALEPGRVAMVSQSGNVAVNALGSLRGIGFHTVISTGNQDRLRRQRLAGGDRRARRGRSVAMFLESDGDGERLPKRSRIAPSGIGVAILKVGATETGAGAASAHTGALAGDQRVFRAPSSRRPAPPGPATRTSCSSCKVLAEPRARPDRRRDEPPGGSRFRTCSRARPPDRPTRRRRSAYRCRKFDPRRGLAVSSSPRPRRWPTRSTTRRRSGPSASGSPDRSRGGRRPGIDQLLMHLRPSRRPLGRVRAELAGDPAGTPRGRVAAPAASLLRLDPPRPDRGRDPPSSSSANGVPSVAGLLTALRCALELRAPGDPERLRAIAAAAAVVGGRAALGRRGSPR